MALENEKKFLEKMMADDVLHAKVEAAPDQIAGIAAEAGFDINLADLEKAAKELRYASAPQIKELRKEEMDQVAGGVLWFGDDAPDGHEMGCVVAYHGYNWSVENNTWCTEMWSCLSNNIEGDPNDGTVTI